MAADDPLVPVALALLDGEPVDWAEIGRTLKGPDERQMLERLQALAPVLKLGEGGARSWADLRIIDGIGSGAFGDVYSAWDDRLGREVALKLLRPRGEAAASEALLDEARRLAQIKHPGVVTVYGADCAEGRVGFWMELLRGQTLGSLARSHGRFGAAEATLIGLDLCRALAAVHAAGLLHRDLKPDNVIRDEGGRTVLTDFGAGGLQDADRALAGTPLFMAPEVLDGGPPSASTDLYSLGVLLYHLVTGSHPVAARTVTELRAAHARGERTRLRDARPDLPSAFVQAVEKAIGPAASRFRSAGEMEAALARCVEPERSRARLTTVAAAATAAFAAAGLAALMFGPRGERPSPPPVTAPAAGAAQTAVPPAPATVPVSARLFRASAGSPARELRDGDRVATGDRLHLTVQAPFDVYVYVVDEDERGDAYLLFPLPGEVQNPLAGGRRHRLPGPQGGRALDWQVTSAGGREHILVFAARERQPVFEEVVSGLPMAQLGHPVHAWPLPRGAVSPLRGIGGLVEVTNEGQVRVVGQKVARLSGDISRGPWLHEIVLRNP
jgi:hypothetical protein